MCSISKSILFSVGIGLSFVAGVAKGQPIDVATATGEYAGGGVVLTADDLREIARGDDYPVGEGVRGGGVGNVLLVECNGAFGFASIQSAIDASVDGDVVVVLPNDCTDEGRWFENIDFLGKAIRVQSANPADAAIVDATVIDGNAAGTVVRFVNGEGADSVLDGVTVTNGDTVGFQAGGGITIIESQPTIRRCLIRENSASLGGGILSQGSDATSVEHCRFESNTATFGSAIGVTGWISVTDCDFQQHESAVIVSDFGTPTSCTQGDYCYLFERCRFMENSAHFGGSGFRICDSEFLNNESASLSVKWSAIERCVFDGNGPNSNGLIAQADHVSVLDCDFRNNSQRCLHVYWDTNVEHCRFTNNTAQVISFYGRNNSFIDCRLEDNVSNGAPMEVLIAESNTIRNCDFINNTSMGYGAGALRLGIVHNGFTADIKNCRFISNHGNSGPGAILASVADIYDCLFVGNTSESNTSAIAGNVVTISGSTIVGNLSKTFSGAVTGAQITNSIVFNNRDAYGDGHQSQATQATTATFSNIQNLQYNFTPGGISNALAGNISLDPRFVDPGHWDDMGTPADLLDDVFVPGDYHLLPESPCIDGGEPGFVADVDATDLDGEPRVQSCRVDMGVDEFTQDAVDVPGDFDGDGVVTVNDVAAFLDVVVVSRGLGVCRADLNGDGFADGRDVALMAGVLLGE